MSKNTISNSVIRRLPRYYRFLGELETNGYVRISSRELSEKMGLTASQIRQDFNCFGEFGQQGYGYNVRYLREEIAKILGLNTEHKMIIIGAGHLGTALANYNFEKNGFKTISLFDVNPELIGGKVRDIPIRSIDELPEFLRENPVDIATLCLPKAKAKDIAQLLIDNGIKAIWNFAHTDLNLILPKDVVVENVHLSESLMRLSYTLKSRQQGEEE